MSKLRAVGPGRGIVRHLHRVSRRLSDRGDRRTRRDRREHLHQLPDDRESRRRPVRPEGETRRMGFRMRHLLRGLPVRFEAAGPRESVRDARGGFEPRTRRVGRARRSSRSPSRGLAAATPGPGGSRAECGARTWNATFGRGTPCTAPRPRLRSFLDGEGDRRLVARARASDRRGYTRCARNGRRAGGRSRGAGIDPRVARRLPLTRDAPDVRSVRHPRRPSNPFDGQRFPVRIPPQRVQPPLRPLDPFGFARLPGCAQRAIDRRYAALHILHTIS